MFYLNNTIRSICVAAAVGKKWTNTERRRAEGAANISVASTGEMVEVFSSHRHCRHRIII